LRSVFIIKLLGFLLNMGLLDTRLVTGVLPEGEFCNELYQYGHPALDAPDPIKGLQFHFLH